MRNRNLRRRRNRKMKRHLIFNNYRIGSRRIENYLRRLTQEDTFGLLMQIWRLTFAKNILNWLISLLEELFLNISFQKQMTLNYTNN